jgi:hypothetical protein
MDRRTTIKWMLAASAAMPLLGQRSFGQSVTASESAAGGYGTDPDLTYTHHPGDVWPLSFTEAERRCATVLCDLIIPADEVSPSASSVGVVEFLDEWVSAPYPKQREDRPIILDGLKWLDEEAMRRSRQAPAGAAGKSFADIASSEQHALCNELCYAGAVESRFAVAATFFARFRDLVAGGFYSTPAGRKDLGYIGNVPRTSFPAPPLELLQKLGLSSSLK